MSKRLIINADDFGLCTGVNRGIAHAHTNGVLTSTTLMAGAPGALEAVELAAKMPDLGIGIHLNLLEGKPVSNDPKVAVLLNDKGEFTYSASKIAVMTLTGKRVRQAIEMEMTAQIQWAIDHGIKPTHLDSHKHVHTFPTIWPIAARLAGRFEIPALRWPWEPAWVANCTSPPPDKGGKKRAFMVRTMARMNLWTAKDLKRNKWLLGIAHTGRIDSEFWVMIAPRVPCGVSEVMTHPGYTDGLDRDKTRLIEQRVVELEALCSDPVKKMLKDADIKLTNYGKL